MGAIFCLLLTCVVSWYIVGTVWMASVIFDKATIKENRIAAKNVADYKLPRPSVPVDDSKNDEPPSGFTCLFMVFLIPLAINVILPFICFFVHPVSIPIGMLYLAVLLNIILCYFLYTFVSPILTGLENAPNDKGLHRNFEKTHFQLNILCTLISIIWTFLVWKALVS